MDDAQVGVLQGKLSRVAGERGYVVSEFQGLGDQLPSGSAGRPDDEKAARAGFA